MIAEATHNNDLVSEKRTEIIRNRLKGIAGEETLLVVELCSVIVFGKSLQSTFEAPNFSAEASKQWNDVSNDSQT